MRSTLQAVKGLQAGILKVGSIPMNWLAVFLSSSLHTRQLLMIFLASGLGCGIQHTLLDLDTQSLTSRL